MYASAGLEAGSPRAKLGKESSGELTELGAAINLLKFVIGLGIISLPEATKHVGWLSSITGLAIVGFVTVWGIIFALRSRDKLDQQEQEAPTRAMTEGDPLTSQGSWQDQPDMGIGFFEKIVGKVWGRPVQYLFAACIVMGQFVTLVIYLNVICTNFESYFPHTAGRPDQSVHLVILCSTVLVLGMFSLIPTLEGVAILSALGLSIYTYLFIGILHEFLHKAHHGTLPQSAVAARGLSTTHYGEWFGVSCFAFSAFPIAIAIYDEMRTPASFQRVLGWCFVAIWIVYSAFAVLGYMCYGDQTNVLIYFNFPEGSKFRDTAAGALACILCFSFVVQAMPVFNCTARAWESTRLSARVGFPGGGLAIVRWTVLALTVAVAYWVPNLKVLLNTVGAVSGVLSGFCIPAATYLKLSSRDEWFERMLGVLVVVVGISGAYWSCMSPNK